MIPRVTVAEGGRPSDPSRSTERIARWACTFANFWTYPALRHIWIQLGLAIIILGYCLSRARIGLAGSEGFSHDAFFVLDGAWRMMHHQRPHADFSSLVGFLGYAPTVVGFWISNGRVQGFGYGQCLVGLLLSAWGYALGRRRLLDIPLILMCLAVAVTAAAPTVLGFSPIMISPGMTYNRYGYALLALIPIEALVDTLPAFRRRDFTGGFSTGAVIVILLFLKITFFLVALLLVVTLVPSRAQTKARWKGLAAGFAALMIICSSYYSFNLMPVVHDLTMAAHTRRISVGLYMFDSIFQDAATLFAFCVAAGCFLLTCNQPKLARNVFTAGGAVGVCGTLAIFGNYEQYGLPLTAFLVIIIIDAITKELPPSNLASDLFRGCVLLLGSVLIAVPLLSGAAGMSFGIYRKFWTASYFPAMNSDRLSGFIPVHGDTAYTRMVNDGISLLRSLRRDNETVMSLDFSNSFSFGLGIPPAPGGINGLQYDSTFNDEYHQSAEQLYGSADLVMIPKTFSDSSLQDSIPRIYGPYLASHFSRIGESDAWRLYRRNSRVPPASDAPR